MKYVGRLASNGKVFDQTKGNKPFTFRLGVGEVIKVRAFCSGMVFSGRKLGFRSQTAICMV